MDPQQSPDEVCARKTLCFTAQHTCAAKMHASCGFPRDRQPKGSAHRVLCRRGFSLSVYSPCSCTPSPPQSEGRASGRRATLRTRAKKRKRAALPFEAPRRSTCLPQHLPSAAEPSSDLGTSPPSPSARLRRENATYFRSAGRNVCTCVCDSRFLSFCSTFFYSSLLMLFRGTPSPVSHPPFLSQNTSTRHTTL